MQIFRQLEVIANVKTCRTFGRAVACEVVGRYSYHSRVVSQCRDLQSSTVSLCCLLVQNTLSTSHQSNQLNNAYQAWCVISFEIISAAPLKCRHLINVCLLIVDHCWHIHDQSITLHIIECCDVCQIRPMSLHLLQNG